MIGSQNAIGKFRGQMELLHQAHDQLHWFGGKREQHAQSAEGQHPGGQLAGTFQRAGVNDPLAEYSGLHPLCSRLTGEQQAGHEHAEGSDEKRCERDEQEFPVNPRGAQSYHQAAACHHQIQPGIVGDREHQRSNDQGEQLVGGIQSAHGAWLLSLAY